MYGLGDKTMGGIYNKPAEMPGPPMWLYYTVVPDVNEAAEKVKAKGGQVLNGPMEVPGGSGDMIAQCMDPQGAPFAIHSHATG
jgi:predicted enzyme related to lactoylglutathione lyase